MFADFLIFDFETFSTIGWNCKVLSFSAIAGNWDNVESYSNMKELDIVFDSNQPGRIADPITVKWWKGQSDEVKNQFRKPKTVIKDFIQIFDQFCHENIDNKTKIYCRGLDFDPVVLKSIYYQHGRTEIPYNFNMLRDIRTVLDDYTGLTYIPKFREYVEKKYGWKEHISMDDCKRDLLQLHVCLSDKLENTLNDIKLTVV